MVATNRRQRRHCSTCGIEFPTPKHGAYCTKHCELHRRSRLDLWLSPIFARRLELSRRLETSMPWEREGLLAQIAETEREELAALKGLRSGRTPEAAQ